MVIENIHCIILDLGGLGIIRQDTAKGDRCATGRPGRTARDGNIRSGHVGPAPLSRLAWGREAEAG
jgi:hypothetical protein